MPWHFGGPAEFTIAEARVYRRRRVETAKQPRKANPQATRAGKRRR